MTMDYRCDEACALELDGQDPLARFRERFHLPEGDDGRELVYLCGNSLGLQPKTTAGELGEVLEAWKNLGVEGHMEGEKPWISYHELLTEKGAALVGAKPSEVVHMNTLTVNLHLMMVSFYRPREGRYKILLERQAFPSDRYAVESQVRLHGHAAEDALIEIGPREGEALIREEDLHGAIEREGPSIALILLPGVQYYSGQVFDMRRIAELGHAQGCAVGFDLAHAAGNIPLELHEWGADFACWCTYKYLNSGPGAIAGCFVHERHVKRPGLLRFAGWWGHDKSTRFEMGPDFRPIPTAEGWQLSNPPITALAPVLASLEIFAEAGMQALRVKSLRLTGYLEFLLRERLAGRIEIITPTAPEKRGCQLSLRIVGAGGRTGRAVFDALGIAGAVCDWREPDVIRVAPAPLYNSFADVHRFTELLERVCS